VAAPILQVRDLRTHFNTPHGVARAVDGISFEVHPGETLAIVGESGCGKSVTSLSIMGLLPSSSFHPTGELWFQPRPDQPARDLLKLTEAERCRVRGAEAAMIFQEPMTSLNPILRVGNQVGEVLRHHKGISKQQAREAATELLARVGIPDPVRRIDDYPHQLSGGMKQRVMIAMALACDPRLLIADEPTTALDVTVQAQILSLLRRLQQAQNMGVVLITHDLGVVAEVADRVVVMYAGRVVESAPTAELFRKPRHPYTLGLLRSLPPLRGPRGRLATIQGMVPRATQYPAGCRFRGRCALAEDRCGSEEPPLTQEGPTHAAACHRLDAVDAWVAGTAPA